MAVSKDVRSAVLAWFSDASSTVNVDAMRKRFWAFTTTGLVRTPECLLFTGTVTRQGYGGFTIKGVLVLAHRVAYRLEVGPIPKGYTVDHSRAKGCSENPLCINPLHLEAVTRGTNAARRRNLMIFT
jgi:hypothetical protein